MTPRWWQGDQLDFFPCLCLSVPIVFNTPSDFKVGIHIYIYLHLQTPLIKLCALSLSQYPSCNSYSNSVLLSKGQHGKCDLLHCWLTWNMSNTSLSSSSRLDQSFHVTRYKVPKNFSESYVDCLLFVSVVFSLQRESFSLRGRLGKPVLSQHQVPIGRL